MYQPLIIQHLFQVSSLEEVSRERLESFVESYPSFGVGHYLLSRKLQTEGADGFQPEAQRTCLYFSNPLWLQWLLQNEGGTQVAEPAPAVVEPAVVVEETPIMVPEEPVEEAPAVTPEEPVENVVTMAEEAFIGTASGDDLAEALTTAEGTDEGSSAAEQLLRSIEEAKGIRESLHKLNEDFTEETALAGEPLPEEPTANYEVHVTPEDQPLAEDEPIHDEEAAFVLEETEEQPAETSSEDKMAAAIGRVAAAIGPIVAEPAAMPVQPEPLPVPTTPEPVQTTAPEQTPQPEMPKPAAATATQDFLFEPYHTIDYFASQGIKLTLDENPPDKLGKQLKSFTEWLKTMRRLPQKDREVVPDRVAEEAVQTIAAHSIEGKDIVTETMAEVLAKQGMREKARAVYEKLSLLNPDKRAYFASKIEQLNIS